MTQPPIPVPRRSAGSAATRPRDTVGSSLPAWLIVVMVGATGLNLRATLGRHHPAGPVGAPLLRWLDGRPLVPPWAGSRP